MPYITKLAVEVDCGLQSGRGFLVIALTKGKQSERKTRVSTLGGAERRLSDQCLLYHLNALAEQPGDPQKRPHGDRHAGDPPALLHLQRPAQYSANIRQVRMVLID